jgi:hypothetical protein
VSQLRPWGPAAVQAPAAAQRRAPLTERCSRSVGMVAPPPPGLGAGVVARAAAATLAIGIVSACAWQETGKLRDAARAKGV